jgi:predicted phosphodiesterase
VRYALISDVHANLPALEAVLRDIDRRGDIDAVHHLGDLVGYAPWPNEVAALLDARRITGVAGNYDTTIATDYKHCGCRSESARQEELAHLSFEWTRGAVTRETKRLLAALPFRLDLKPRGGHAAGPRITLVHATPVNNLVYVTEDRSDEFLTRLASQAGLGNGDVLCFGHTHKPWHRVVGGVHFINTGSVGRPKDGDWRAGYVVLDVSGSGPDVGVEFVRVAYDVDAAAAAIETAGLPLEFADFLRAGGAVPAV